MMCYWTDDYYLYMNCLILLKTYQKWFLYQSYYIENKETDTGTQMIKKYTIYNFSYYKSNEYHTLSQNW